ncbi:hypothetical protein PT974_07363 [Cladobotryum mycophilum]|uniref:DUF7703 domain-containing protein n=1 Tax=Cladobotryum mycophilum TaxID=491253 RepID=A0ABR0SP41_9HYPO
MTGWITGRGFGSGVQGLGSLSLTIITVFLSIACYNVIELFIVIAVTFKRYAGLYFWSFLVATSGVALSSSGFFIKYFGPHSLGYLSCTLSLMGWVSMVTGQSMVLWSRLHLVMRHERRLQIILWIIIIDAVVCHGTIIPMVYGSFSSNPEIWEKPYSIAEKIEVIIFFLQEITISILYIIETIDFMRPKRPSSNRRSSRRLMKNLIIVNVLVILLDITILTLEFENLYNYQISYKPLAYSVKLKIEFTVLNDLVDLTTEKKELKSLQLTNSCAESNNTDTGIQTASSSSKKTISSHVEAVGGSESYRELPISNEIPD